MRILIWGIVGLSGLGFAVQALGIRGSKNESAAIRHAVRAPFGDLRRHDARGLCEDFAPSVAAHLTTGSGRCEAAVTTLFGRGAADPEISGEHSSQRRLVKVTDIHWHGEQASAEVVLDVPSQEAPHRFRLRMIGRHWRIATPASLQLRPDCRQLSSGIRPCVEALSMRMGS